MLANYACAGKIWRPPTNLATFVSTYLACIQGTPMVSVFMLIAVGVVVLLMVIVAIVVAVAAASGSRNDRE